MERQLRHRRVSLAHVDACLRLLDPATEPESLPLKRTPKHIKLFRQGELGRLDLDVLGNADTPESTQEIVGAILDAGGRGKSATPSVMPRVRGNLA